MSFHFDIAGWGFSLQLFTLSLIERSHVKYSARVFYVKNGCRCFRVWQRVKTFESEYSTSGINA